MSARNSEIVDSENYRKLMSFTYSISGLRDNTIDAASLFSTHSDLNYDGRWNTKDLVMRDEEVEKELLEIMNQLDADLCAYRFLREELDSEDLSEREEELYSGVKEVGDDIVIGEAMPLRNQFNNVFLEDYPLV